MKKSMILEFFAALPTVVKHHAPNSKLYTFMKSAIEKEIQTLFKNENGKGIDFQPFGHLFFPFYSMGSITSMNLFEIDELMMFGFYWANRERYKRVLDVGANLGLHSILLSKCGYEVFSYEPDPTHFKILTENLRLNNISNAVHLNNKAVSNKDGEAEFTRVKGNTTGSHLSGAKPNPYGELETFKVEVVNIQNILNGVDFIKLDIEAHEKDVIPETTYNDWVNTDGMISIHDKGNAEVVYNHFRKLGLNQFSQKINWELATSLEDIPTSHHEGTLFVTAKDQMPWSENEII
jgi:FkbM family methyltransferase